jgi:hypothetical protein
LRIQRWIGIDGIVPREKMTIEIFSKSFPYLAPVEPIYFLDAALDEKCSNFVLGGERILARKNR